MGEQRRADAGHAGGRLAARLRLQAGGAEAELERGRRRGAELSERWRAAPGELEQARGAGGPRSRAPAAGWSARGSAVHGGSAGAGSRGAGVGAKAGGARAQRAGGVRQRGARPEAVCGRKQRRATAAWRHTGDTRAGVEPRAWRRWNGWRRRTWWRGRRGAEAHAARACAGVARQGRSKRGSGSKKRRSSCVNVQSDGVQRMAVSPLSELKPRPVGVQESRAQCGRSYSVAATDKSARE
ncbi:spidroin-1-like [Panicum hallii]|uniref:spidroin-1-like n=1 Tax=Panicum hallii TaxID=206008 RepID=UPI000DF4E9A2|nr:spidroin-1-like [Panicum hallii]